VAAITHSVSEHVVRGRISSGYFSGDQGCPYSNPGR